MKTMFTSTRIQNVDSNLRAFSFSNVSEKQKCGSGFKMEAGN